MGHHRRFLTSGLGFASIAAFVGGAGAGGPFPSHNVTLLSWVDNGDFASMPTGGNDIWGYVSPSGREYALVGLRNAFAVVEITTPASPVIIAEVSPHAECRWGSVKVYQSYCYYASESVCDGPTGVDIYDLSDVDNGNVTFVGELPGGVMGTHTISADTDSGFLYLNGSDLTFGGHMAAYDLANPASPVLAGQVSDIEGVFAHDSQVVTYTTGPYAGKQIAFVSTGSDEAGLDIFDVTDKSNMFRLSRTTYPKFSYAHQCWLDSTRQYLYCNDETDQVNETVVFDVSDLAEPQLITTYTAGVTARDHNQYVHDGFMYESDYRAGLRIFCLEDPLHPVQVGWFDTYPEDDIDDPDQVDQGAWGSYPFFPSGTVVVNDRSRALFVLDVSAALSAGGLKLEYPNGRPGVIDAQGGSSIRVDVTGVCGGAQAAGSGLLYLDSGSGFTSVPMVQVDADSYDAVFPAVPCAKDVSYYVTVEDAGGAVFADPAGVLVNTQPHTATAITDTSLVFEDDFENDLGWVAQSFGATSGFWQRGAPVNDPSWPYDPDGDGDGSGQCYLTQNALGDTDVDGGFVQLTSPQLDMSAGDILISYEYFLQLSKTAGTDVLRVQISSNGNAGPFTEIARHVMDGNLGWRHHDISPDQLQALGVAMTSNMKVRFGALDQSPDSIVEAGIDGFKLTRLLCTGDLDGDGFVSITDLFVMFAQWGPCGLPCPPSCTADFNGDCFVNIVDLFVLFANWSAPS